MKFGFRITFEKKFSNKNFNRRLLLSFYDLVNIPSTQKNGLNLQLELKMEVKRKNN